MIPLMKQLKLLTERLNRSEKAVLIFPLYAGREEMVLRPVHFQMV